MANLPLSMLFGELETEIRRCSSLSLFEKTTFDKLKNFTVDGITLMKMVTVIKKLEEKFGAGTRKFFTTPKKYHSLVADLKEKHCNGNESKRTEYYEFFETVEFFNDVEEYRKSVGGTKVPVKDIIRLEKYNDDQQMDSWIYTISQALNVSSRFLEYLRTISIVLLNMVDFDAPLHIFMTILLVPLHEFLKKADRRIYFDEWNRMGQGQLPEIEKIHPKILIHNMNWNLEFSNPAFSPEIQIIFSVLSNPQNYLEKKKIDEFICRNHVSPTFGYKQFIETFFPKATVKQPRFKIDMGDFSVIRNYLESEYVECVKKVETGSPCSSKEMSSKRKYVDDCFQIAFATITRWETAVEIFEKLFPREESGDARNYNPFGSHSV